MIEQSTHLPCQSLRSRSSNSLWNCRQASGRWIVWVRETADGRRCECHRFLRRPSELPSQRLPWPWPRLADRLSATTRGVSRRASELNRPGVARDQRTQACVACKCMCLATPSDLLRRIGSSPAGSEPCLLCLLPYWTTRERICFCSGASWVRGTAASPRPRTSLWTSRFPLRTSLQWPPAILCARPSEA